MEKVYSLIEWKKTEYINNRTRVVNGLTVGRGSTIMVPGIGLVQVLGVTKEQYLFCLCKNILFESVFDKIDWSIDNKIDWSNDYAKSALRKELKKYCQEKTPKDIGNAIVPVKVLETKGKTDKLFLLSEQEVEMLPRAERNCGESWWLRSAVRTSVISVLMVSADGSWRHSISAYYNLGVRPAFFLDLDTVRLRQGKDGIIEVISEVE